MFDNRYRPTRSLPRDKVRQTFKIMMAEKNMMSASRHSTKYLFWYVYRHRLHGTPKLSIAFTTKINVRTHDNLESFWSRVIICLVNTASCMRSYHLNCFLLMSVICHVPSFYCGYVSRRPTGVAILLVRISSILSAVVFALVCCAVSCSVGSLFIELAKCYFFII